MKNKTEKGKLRKRVSMKKLIFITTLLIFPVFIYAQKDFDAETYFGIKGGANLAQLLTNPTIDESFINGFTGGFVFKHIAQKNLGVQLEINYKQSGWEETLDNNNSYSRKFNLLEIPLMTNVYFGKNNTRFISNIGPYVSYILSENEKINVAEDFEKPAYYGNETDNKGAFGVCFGIGLSHKTPIGVFQIESRVSCSLTDVLSNKTTATYSSSKNLNAEFTLAYLIDYRELKKSKKEHKK